LSPATSGNSCQQLEILNEAKPGGTFLLNSRLMTPPQETWLRLPQSIQQGIIDKQLKVYAINAYKVASEAGMRNRINTVMQTCFFALSGCCLEGSDRRHQAGHPQNLRQKRAKKSSP
jgi:Pyruvate/2-oxoacid:ferredoxin oxidoreductase gamma subunit